MSLPGIASIGGFASIVRDFVSFASGEVNAATSLTINKPSGTQNGDILVAIMAGSDTDVTWTGDTSWTEQIDEGSGGSLRVATLSAGVSEPSSYTFTASASCTAVGQIICFRGLSYDTIGSIDNSTSGTNQDATGLTSAGGIIIAAYSGVLTGLSPSISYSTPTGMTAIRTTTSSSNKNAIGTFYQVVTAGVIGIKTTNFSVSGGSYSRTSSIMVGLK